MKNSSVILAFSALFLASCAHTSTTATYGLDARTQALINEKLAPDSISGKKMALSSASRNKV